MCACSGGTSSVSTTIKEAVFCNFDLTSRPCCVHPPTPPFDEGGSLEGRVQQQSHMSNFLKIPSTIPRSPLFPIYQTTEEFPNS